MDEVLLLYVEPLIPAVESAGNLASGMLKDLMIHVPLFLVLVISIAASLLFVLKWKLREDPYRPSNFTIFGGQLLLAFALYCSYESMTAFRIATVKSYVLSAISCYLLIVSVLLSYNFKKPPSQVLGYLMYFLGAVCHVISVVYAIRLEKEGPKVPSIIGSNAAVAIGVSILIMNLLKTVYEAQLDRHKQQLKSN